MNRPRNTRVGRYAVIDLETSGLDHTEHVIIEIGCGVVDRHHRMVDAGVSVVVHHEPDTLHSLMDATVRAMHTTNGLINACGESPFTLNDAENVMLDYLTYWGGERTLGLMNNNAPFERSWLATHLPNLNNHLHHANLDVSAIRRMTHDQHPSVYASRPERTREHRALPDVRACVAELAHYKANLVAVPDLAPRELVEFINPRTVPGRVRQWDMVSGGDVPVADFGTPAEAREFALRLMAAANHIETHIAVGEPSGGG